jgi:hypothetical protein
LLPMAFLVLSESVDLLGVLPLDSGSRASWRHFSVEGFGYAFSLAVRGARRDLRRVLYPGRNFVQQDTPVRCPPEVEWSLELNEENRREIIKYGRISSVNCTGWSRGTTLIKCFNIWWELVRAELIRSNSFHLCKWCSCL